LETTPEQRKKSRTVRAVLPGKIRAARGRNGQIFTSEGTINLRNKKWEDDFSPIDPEGTAFVDTVYTKAYLHHLVVCGEMLAAQIASLHNVAFYLRLVKQAREHIVAGDFKAWKESMIPRLARRL